MDTRIFKTNIKCGVCIEKVTHSLNNLVGVGNWSVDVAQPTKPLTINNPSVSVENLKDTLGKVGYSVKD